MIAQLLVQTNETAINKAHGLLLLYLSRVPLPADLLYEVRKILPQCVRITHALVDVISSFGFLKPLILCMQFCQMLIQGMWINDSPLLQIVDKSVSQTL
jgi:hypothetical protein